MGFLACTSAQGANNKIAFHGAICHWTFSFLLYFSTITCFDFLYGRKIPVSAVQASRSRHAEHLFCLLELLVTGRHWGVCHRAAD